MRFLGVLLGCLRGKRTGEALRGGCQGGHLPALPLQGPGEAVPPWVSSLQSLGLGDPFCESRLELVSCPHPAGGHLRDGESPSTGLSGWRWEKKPSSILLVQR